MSYRNIQANTTNKVCIIQGSKYENSPNHKFTAHQDISVYVFQELGDKKTWRSSKLDKPGEPNVHNSRTLQLPGQKHSVR